MKPSAFIVSIVYCFSIVGCNDSYKSIPLLKPQKVKYQFKDSTYFSSTWNIQGYNGILFITDSRNERVLKLDTTLKLIQTFGKAGRGPGEFNYIGSIIANKDSLYVYDGGGMRFHVYNLEGDYIRSFPIPYLLSDARVTLINNKLYMSSRYISDDHSSIFVTNLDGNVIRYFEKNPSANPRINFTNRLLFSSSYKNQIIAVSTSEPFVERYSTKGEFMGSYDLRNIRSLYHLWDLYSKKKAQNTRRNKTLLFADAYMDGTSLYIMCAGWPGRDNYTYIIKLEIKESSIKPVSVFKLQGAENHPALFKTVFVDRNVLVATEISTQAIYKFDLSELK